MSEGSRVGRRVVSVVVVVDVSGSGENCVGLEIGSLAD